MIKRGFIAQILISSSTVRCLLIISTLTAVLDRVSERSVYKVKTRSNGNNLRKHLAYSKFKERTYITGSVSFTGGGIRWGPSRLIDLLLQE